MTMPLEYILWLDACSDACMEWTDLDDCTFHLEECETVGWVVHEDDACIALVQSRHETGGDTRISAAMTIPKALIVKRARMEPVEVIPVVGDTPPAGLPMSTTASIGREIDGLVIEALNTHTPKAGWE